LVIKHFTMDYHEFSIYYGILFYNFPFFIFAYQPNMF